MLYNFSFIFVYCLSARMEKKGFFHAPMDTLSLTKEAKICNGEKTISLTSGAGKSGQPPVKE